MTTQHVPPSIFNDVIGPAMRGPSSSHCAAFARIGLTARNLMGKTLNAIEVIYDPSGAIATTHETQGTDMGLLSGLLGFLPTDDRLKDYKNEFSKSGIQYYLKYQEINVDNPNICKLTLSNSAEKISLLAVSTGGGMFEITTINDFKVSIKGDCFETLIIVDEEVDINLDTFDSDENIISIETIKNNKNKRLHQIKSQTALSKNLLASIQDVYPNVYIKTNPLILPVQTPKNLSVPFTTCSEMLEYNQGKDHKLSELAIIYESARGNLEQSLVFSKMTELIQLMISSILKNLKGNQFEDRVLGYQSGKYVDELKKKSLLDIGILNLMIPYITAMMEAKSSLDVVVAAPTAGACAGLPGAVIGAAHSMGLSERKMTEAMLAAGMIGVFIAEKSTFAAEVGGCQAECGSGSGMAAAALVSLAGGTTEQSVAAASMAMQNVMGLICDPVANRVEVPCLGKNVLAASNAVANANMAMAGYDQVIPLDEVIQATEKVGRSIPRECRCTALGGLSITETSQEIEKKLALRNSSNFE